MWLAALTIGEAISLKYVLAYNQNTYNVWVSLNAREIE
jgi:hypothetical protein